MSDKKSNTKPCKSCEHEVAKSAKKCPNCGQKLKSGMFTKLLIGVIVLIVAGVALQPSSEDQLQVLSQSQISDLSPYGELNAAFAFGSDYTDIQREKLETDINGLTVAWELPVYEVSKSSEGRYRVVTNSSGGASGGAVAAVISIYTSSSEENGYVESLMTGDIISFKGTVTGTSVRRITISPAVLNR